MTFKIRDRSIGGDSPAFIIAEIGQAHDGSLGTAHAYIDAVATTGVDAIKFQTHIADAESTPHEKFRVNTFPQDATRYDYWHRMEFTPEQWKGLSDHAADKGLIFLSSPFSMQAVDILEALDIAAWKVASGETSNLPMVERMARTGKPLLVSTGMSPWQAIDQTVDDLNRLDAKFGIFQCTSAYPCPPETIGLNIIAELQQRYGCPAGLSDHSGTIFPSLAAIPLGAKLIEVHAVFSRECFGPDVKSSLTTAELTKLVEGIRFTEAMLASPVDKDAQAEKMKDMSALFGKSLYANRDLDEGEVVGEADIGLKKPGTGIPARRLSEFIGRRLTRSYKKNEKLEEKDFA